VAHRRGTGVTLKPHIWSRDFWEGREWQGAYFWKTFTVSEVAEAGGDGPDYSFRNRPAEAVLRKWCGSSARDRQLCDPAGSCCLGNVNVAVKRVLRENRLNALPQSVHMYYQ